MSQCQNSRITSVTITSYNVNLSMLQKRLLPFESYIALVTIERPESIVLSHVTLQIARRSANIIALVAVVWFFSWMIPYHVEFQLICNNARKFALVHLLGFSPEWVLLCTLRLLELAVEYSHWLQLFDFSPICFAILCSFRWLELTVEYSHWLQWCGLNPVCFKMCNLRWSDLLVE